MKISGYGQLLDMKAAEKSLSNPTTSTSAAATSSSLIKSLSPSAFDSATTAPTTSASTATDSFSSTSTLTSTATTTPIPAPKFPGLDQNQSPRTPVAPPAKGDQPSARPKKSTKSPATPVVDQSSTALDIDQSPTKSEKRKTEAKGFSVTKVSSLDNDDYVSPLIVTKLAGAGLGGLKDYDGKFIMSEVELQGWIDKSSLNIGKESCFDIIARNPADFNFTNTDLSKLSLGSVYFIKPVAIPTTSDGANKEVVANDLEIARAKEERDQAAKRLESWKVHLALGQVLWELGPTIDEEARALNEVWADGNERLFSIFAGLGSRSAHIAKYNADQVSIISRDSLVFLCADSFSSQKKKSGSPVSFAFSVNPAFTPDSDSDSNSDPAALQFYTLKITTCRETDVVNKTRKTTTKWPKCCNRVGISFAIDAKVHAGGGSRITSSNTEITSFLQLPRPLIRQLHAHA
jgi:hypothetical protein